MDWSLLAGGLSKGLEGGLAGANTGLLQSEQIRHQRAQEGLQQQHFGLQQQQLERALRQQDINNQFMQQRMGLQGRQLDLATQRALAEQAYREAQLGNLQSRTRLQEERLPFQIERDKAYAEWMRRRQSAGTGSGGWEAQYKNGLATRMGYDSYLDAKPEDRALIDQEFSKSGRGYDIKAGNLDERRLMDAYRRNRMELLNAHTIATTQHLNQLMSSPSIGGPEKLALDAIRAKLNNYNAAMNRIQRDQSMGQPGNPKDLAYVDTIDVGALENAISQIEQQVRTRAVPLPGSQPQAPSQPAAPVAPTYQDLRKKWLGK